MIISASRALVTRYLRAIKTTTFYKKSDAVSVHASSETSTTEIMKPDQERVNNLLRDTVTLLCKNGLTYSDELRVEALIGITVDSNDVFLVHINEKFGPGGENKVPNPPEESKEDTRDSARPQSNTNSNSGRECAAETPQASPAQSDRVQRTLSVDSSSLSSPQGAASSQMDLSKVKLEAVDSDDECIVVKSPGTVARQANMIAGQRRVLHRPRSYASPSHSGLQANQDDTHAMRQRYAQDMAGSEEAYTDYDPDTGEPPVKIKRQAADDEDTYGSSYNQHMDNNQGNIGTHWPHVAGMGDMAAQSFQDSGDSQISASDVSMPGCSSWSVAGGAQRSMMPHQGSDMVGVSLSSFFLFWGTGVFGDHQSELLVESRLALSH